MQSWCADTSRRRPCDEGPVGGGDGRRHRSGSLSADDDAPAMAGSSRSRCVVLWRGQAADLQSGCGGGVAPRRFGAELDIGDLATVVARFSERAWRSPSRSSPQRNWGVLLEVSPHAARQISKFLQERFKE
jgi:hypothetical protein